MANTSPRLLAEALRTAAREAARYEREAMVTGRHALADAYRKRRTHLSREADRIDDPSTGTCRLLAGRLP